MGMMLQPPPGFESRAVRLRMLAFWVAMGALETGKEFVVAQLQQQPRGLGDAVLINFPWWCSWALLTLVVAHFATRWPLDGSRVVLNVVRHASLGLALVTIHLALVGVLLASTRTRTPVRIRFSGRDLFGGLNGVVCGDDGANSALSGLSPSLLGQEMGHGYGLNHSRREGSTVDYTDPFDVMSTDA